MDEKVSHERESGFMSFVLGIPASADPAERRTPIVPDVATKLRALGASLLIQRGATAKAISPSTTWARSRSSTPQKR